MSSKTVFVFIFSLVLMLTATSCDKFFRYNQKGPSQIVQFQATEFLCLKSVPAQLTSYLQDQADEPTTRQIFGCANNVLRVFSNLTTGADSSQYSASELQQFLNHYLDLKSNVTDDLMAQLMKVKVLLIGGSEVSLTRAEITNLKGSLNLLADVAVQLRGHWKYILLVEDAKQVSSARIAQEQDLIQQALFKIIDNARISESHYGWNDFSNLIVSASDYLKSSVKGTSQASQLDFSANFLQLLPMANHVRILFLGEGANQATLADWKKDAQWGLNAYSLVASYHYLFKSISFDDGTGWPQVIGMIDKVFDLLQNAPEMQKQGFFSQIAIDAIIDDLKPSLPNSLDVKRLYPQVILSILERTGKQTGARASFRGLEQRDLAALFFEYRVWRTVEMQLLKYSTELASPQRSESFLQAIAVPDDLASDMADSYANWQKVAKRTYPILMGPTLRLNISKSTSSTPGSFKTLTITNLLRSVARIYLTGYGDGTGDVSSYTFTQNSLLSFSDDFSFVLDALDLQKPKDYSLANRIFTDSRYFTFSGDGGVTGNQDMLMDEMANLISGGVTSLNVLIQKLDQSSCKADNGFYPLYCFAQLFNKEFANVFPGLTDLQQEVKTGRLNLDNLSPVLLSIAQGNPHKVGYLTKAEITNLCVVFFYVESLMAVYDTNHDQKITEEELKKAFPRFKSQIRALSPLPESLDEQAFLYVVYKGEIPSTKDLGSWLQSVLSFGSFEFPSITQTLPPVDRGDLLKVIALLKQQTSSVK
jgi:hypothetical protein